MTRASLAIGLAAAILVWAPAQSREALVVMAEDSTRLIAGLWPFRWPPPIEPTQLTLFVFPLAVGFLGYVCGFVARHALDTLRPKPGITPGWRRQLVRHLPGCCSAFPVLATAAVTAATAQGALPNPETPDVRLRLWVLALVLGAIAAAHYTRWIDPPRWPWSRSISPGRAEPRQREFAGTPREAAAFIVSWAALLLLPLILRPHLLQQAGPLGFAMLMLALWAFPASGLVIFGERVRVPVFTILMAGAVVFSACNLNDNHTIRRTSVAAGASKPWSPPGLQQWLRGRSDIRRRPAEAWPQPYPVYVVAAEGGGMRAAYWTAMVLSRIQDQCPAFAEHVYAISGVSGGAIGAAVFAALVRRDELAAAGAATDRTADPEPTTDLSIRCSSDRDAPPGRLQTLADRVLRRDLLSPTLATALGPDLFQRFLPFSIDAFDRARALERALEDAWREATGDNLMASPLGALWPAAVDGSASGAVPTLLLNTTEVETGRPKTVDEIPTANEREPELRLSTAAVLSARFVGISPAALEPSIRRRFVDGGYFDNSGAVTLLSRMQDEGKGFIDTPDPCFRSCLDDRQRKRQRELEDLYGQQAPGTAPHIAYKVILLRIGTVSSAEPVAGGLGELLSPIRAFVNAREARASIAVEQLSSLVYPTDPEEEINVRLHRFLLCGDRRRVPLGWLLSNYSRHVMQEAVRDKNACLDDSDDHVYDQGTVSNAASFETLMSGLSAMLQQGRHAYGGVEDGRR